jgi:ATP-dependent Lhr-like helicase
VRSRRWLDPETASDLGALDPAAIARVREEAWPEASNADELHDALMILGGVTAEEGARSGWVPLFEALTGDHRAAVLTAPGTEPLWVAAERLPQFTAAFPSCSWEPPIAPPRPEAVAADVALVEIVRSRIEGLGPVTAGRLGAPLGLPAPAIDVALAALESEGFVLRGRFTPAGDGTGPAPDETEWCERRLLARIHRYTLTRLRQEIEPVTAEELMRFLFRWQGLVGEHRGEGLGTLTRVVEQLEGFSAAAVSWEGDILPARVADYDPAWLDALSFSGRIAWARLVPPRLRETKSAGPVRSTPIALVDRRHLAMWLEAGGVPAAEDAPLSAGARAVLEHLERRGASFHAELAEGTGLLRTRLEEALGELVAWGLVTADGFTGMRALLLPPGRRRPLTPGERRRSTAAFGLEEAGRWNALRQTAESRSNGAPATSATALAPEDLELLAWTLLRRYGVVFRRLLEREGPLPPWRDLLRVYHRLEARGEIRGGRFVGGFSGEQFALTEAVGSLRESRRQSGDAAWVSVSATDPLNLVGLVVPGPRVPAMPGNRILYRGGIPVAIRVAGETRFLERLDPEDEWKAKKTLQHRGYPERLRAYIGLT